MNYISTRGGMRGAHFSQILLEGLASDGGLTIAEHYPTVSSAELLRWRSLSYPALAFEIIRRFADDLDARVLQSLIEKTYTQEIFGDAEITPWLPLAPGLSLLRLSNGPTLAFKDIAMQLLGNLFEYVLQRSGGELNILGATSGDTGSAAEYAMRGKQRIRVFMLTPKGRMSPFQTAQMYSLLDPNIFNIAIEGVFDDAQDIVKAVSEDRSFKASQHIGTVNSINWARVVAQVVYYFKGYFAATRSNSEQVSFAVPTGNFGNIYAGHIARSMGLPLARLICANNENDVLDEFFRSGVYRVRSALETHQTSSPSMDISKASNFERFVFDLVGRDPLETKALWSKVATQGGFDLSQHAGFRAIEERFGLVSSTSSHAERITMIRDTMQSYGVLVDPHTADGLCGARRFLRAGEPMIVLETALAAKFSATVKEALGVEPERPEAFAGLEHLPQRFAQLPASVAAVKAFIARHTGIAEDSAALGARHPAKGTD